jgi:competence protein ComEA
MIVVVVLGTPHLLAHLRARHEERPRGAIATRPVAADPPPAPSLPARSADPLPVAAGERVPDSFRRDPLAFLSRASADSLDLLPGIGPVLATRIVAARREHRPFRSWDDVLEVRGIGPGTIEKWKALVNHR